MNEKNILWGEFQNKVFSPAKDHQKIVQLKRMIISTWQQHETTFKTPEDVLKGIKKLLEKRK